MKYYASKGQIDQVEYARQIGGDILAHFETYFNISYPLPKAGKKLSNSERKVYRKPNIGSRLSSSPSWPNPQVSCVSE